MVGVLLCRGCKEGFCSNHAREHRDMLQNSINSISNECDKLKDTIQGQTVKEHHSSLLVYIEQWERESINKIRRLADESREQLSIITTQNKDDLREKIEQLKQNLELARHDGGFYENDLKIWSERLQELQNWVSQQENLKFEDSIDSSSFIPRIVIAGVSNGVYQKQSDMVLSISTSDNSNNTNEDNHSLVDDEQNGIRNKFMDKPESYNDDRYSYGRHILRFKIDQFESNNSILFGIISRRDSNDSVLQNNPTFYGWTDSTVRLGGQTNTNLNGYTSDFRAGDIYQLIIDCEGKQIHLKSERTNTSYDLDVDTTICSFPWQPNVRILTNF